MDPFHAWLSFAVGDSETEPGGEEGGWNGDDPSVRNPTWRGIEYDEAMAFFGYHNMTFEQFREWITRSKIEQLTYANYWQQFHAEDLRPALAIPYMDGCFNGGGVENLQITLNVLCSARLDVDGDLGPKTLAAMTDTASLSPQVALNAYVAAADMRYRRLSRNPKFAPDLAGWLGRLGRCRTLATAYLPPAASAAQQGPRT